jgi:hypothetical protein
VRYVISLVILAFYGVAYADPQIPDKLVGVWTTDGSVLQGEELISGKALYIDVDGVGAMVSRGGKDASRSRIVVTEYNANSQHIEVDVTAGGAVQHITLNYESAEAIITTPEDEGALYHRRREVVSPDIRQKLGLEAAVHSVPSLKP